MNSFLCYGISFQINNSDDSCAYPRNKKLLQIRIVLYITKYLTGPIEETKCRKLPKNLFFST